MVSIPRQAGILSTVDTGFEERYRPTGILDRERDTAIAAPNVKKKTTRRKTLEQFNDASIAMVEPNEVSSSSK